MSTWTVKTSNTTPIIGTVDQPHVAWNHAFDAAARLVRAGVRDTITLEVDGVPAAIAPATSDASIPATLQVLEDTRHALVTAIKEQP